MRIEGWSYCSKSRVIFAGDKVVVRECEGKECREFTLDEDFLERLKKILISQGAW